MTSDSILLEKSEAESSSTLTEAKTAQHQRYSGIRRYPPSGADDAKKRGYSPLSDTRPSKRQKNSEIQKCKSIPENASLSVVPNELESEILKARHEIFKHFMNMKIRMDNDDKMVAREIEIRTRGGLANISGGKNPQNEFVIKSLVNNFEEMIGNIGQESVRDLNHTMDNIRKILVKLVNRIERSFRPKPCIDSVKVARRDVVKFLWMGLLSIFAVFAAVFPDYVLKAFEFTVVFHQSTILVFFLFCILYFHDLASKKC